MSSPKDLLVRKGRTYTGQDLEILVSGSQVGGVTLRLSSTALGQNRTQC